MHCGDVDEAIKVTYDLCITAVSDRADLFVKAIESILAQVDRQPRRLIVHEDVRYHNHMPLINPGDIQTWLYFNRFRNGLDYVHKITRPAGGLGPAMRWCFEQAQSLIVLYSQENYAALRSVPIKSALAIMEAHALNHVCFGQRQTLPCKHADKDQGPSAQRKVKVMVGGQALCVSDHWCTQTSLWRVAPALEGMQATSDSNQFVARFNRWMDSKHGDQAMRHERLKTYIWGGIGESAFLRRLDHDASRTTGRKRT